MKSFRQDAQYCNLLNLKYDITNTVIHPIITKIPAGIISLRTGIAKFSLYIYQIFRNVSNFDMVYVPSSTKLKYPTDIFVWIFSS